jgi:hypothetical protein
MLLPSPETSFNGSDAARPGLSIVPGPSDPVCFTSTATTNAYPKMDAVAGCERVDVPVVGRPQAARPGVTPTLESGRPHEPGISGPPCRMFVALARR